ncbi:hypothetical protein AArcMg_1494 [Natrarchaeobaculum sulfurireducens]|uniref:Uncharacterized protein n=1 Tax=Natrarchaeobaculum sulfurireducens TaxID=2044521 RepID=A0A346PPR2_9EURY|nr:hypothetical protein AArcMg_1494 [Natrarchaeobaculum sulfurireducens]
MHANSTGGPLAVEAVHHLHHPDHVLPIAHNAVDTGLLQALTVVERDSDQIHVQLNILVRELQDVL